MATALRLPDEWRGAYRSAQLEARRAAGSLSAGAARRVERAVREYADRVAREVRSLRPGSGERRLAEASGRIAREAADDFARAAADAVASGRRVAFTEVYAAWERASARAVAAGVSPGVIPRSPPLTLLAAYENSGGAGTWRTALTRTARDGAAGIDAIVRTALAQGIGPEQLAKRLRPFVAGAEEFHRAFPRGTAFKVLHDLRNVPPDLRRAARLVRHNSLRIAFTEMHNARREAELTAFALDPAVRAVRWLTAFDRGTARVPDICDVYAESDLYGLGRGVYPLDAVPLPPHPWDRCELEPVAGDPSELDTPKPLGLRPDLTKMRLGAYRGVSPEHRARLASILRDNTTALNTTTQPVREMAQAVARQAARSAADVHKTGPLEWTLTPPAKPASPPAEPLRIVSSAEPTKALRELVSIIPDSDVTVFELYSARAAQAGANGLFRVGDRSLHLSPEASGWFAAYARGEVTPEAFKGLRVALHEGFHSASPHMRWRAEGTNWLGLSSAEKEAAHYVEEGLVERRARRYASQFWQNRADASDWRTLPEEYRVTLKSYSAEVSAIDRVARVLGEEAVDDLWQTANPKYRLGDLSDYARRTATELLRGKGLTQHVADEFWNALDDYVSRTHKGQWYKTLEDGRVLAALEKADGRKGLAAWAEDWLGLDRPRIKGLLGQSRRPDPAAIARTLREQAVEIVDVGDDHVTVRLPKDHRDRMYLKQADLALAQHGKHDPYGSRYNNPDPRVQAVNHYVGGGYTPINKVLRGRATWAEATQEYGYGVTDGEFRLAAVEVDKLTRQSRLPKATMVFRGMDSERQLARLTVGAEFRDLGFVSTATDLRTALSFAGSGDTPGAAIVRIHVRRDASAYAVPLEYRNEAEIILPRGSRFRVVRRRSMWVEGQYGGPPHRFTLVDVELLPHLDPGPIPR
jgi:hypothetical protein